MTDTQTTTTEPIVTTTPEAAKPEANKDIQAQLDAVAANVRKETAATTTNKFLKDLGVDSIEALKQVLQAKKEADDAKLDAEQKALKKIADLEKERDEIKRERDEANATRIADRVNGTLEAVARTAKVQHPEDVVKYIRENLADELAKAVGDDGKFADKAAEKLVESVKKARPNWFAVSGPGSLSNRDGRPMQPENKVVLKSKVNF
jgi:acyl carrier protein